MEFNGEELPPIEGINGPEDVMEKEKLEALDKLDDAVKACVNKNLIVGLVVIDPIAKFKVDHPDPNIKTGSMIVEIKTSEEVIENMSEETVKSMVKKGWEIFEQNELPVQIPRNPYDYDFE